MFGGLWGQDSASEEDPLFGRYNVTLCIGRGAFGEVHEAVDLSTNTRVAVKRSYVREANRDIIQPDPQREALCLSLAQGPHTIRMIDAGFYRYVYIHHIVNHRGPVVCPVPYVLLLNETTI